MLTRRLEGIEGLRALREPWLSLHVSADLYARYEWHLACATHLLGDTSALAYVQVLAGGRTVAIVPAIAGRPTVPCLSALRVLGPGLHEHLELADFPLASDVPVEDVAAALRDALAAWPQRWDALFWPRVLASSNALRVARALDAAVVTPRPPCDVLDTRRASPELMAGLSKNLRASLRKSQKRLEQSGGWRIETDAIGAAYQAFLAIEASGWKGRSDSGSAIALDPAARTFYSGLLALRGEEFSPEITILERASTPIAAQFSVRVNGCRHILKIGYVESEARFSPGQVLMASVLESASGALRSINLVTDEPWHQAWRPFAEPAYRIVAFREGWRAALYRACTAVRSIAKSALRARRDTRPAES